MKLDRTFSSEVKKAANGDGGREYRFALIKELRETSTMLGNRYRFDECIKQFGRAKVGLCVANTMVENRHDFESAQITWAMAVMRLWTNKTERSTLAATINIHPAILADNSHFMRKATTVE